MNSTNPNRNSSSLLPEKCGRIFFFFMLTFLSTLIIMVMTPGKAEARHSTHIPKHALEGYITRCSENSAMIGCSPMGEIYENNGKISQALLIYRKHCIKNNDAHSCVLAAEVLQERRRPDEAMELFHKACLMDKAVEYCDRALAEYAGRKDFKNEFRLNRTLCETNSEGSELSRYCYNAGKFLLENNDTAKAEHFYLKGCNSQSTADEQNHCIDQAVTLAQQGEYRLSAKLFEVSCLKNSLYSCHHGALIYIQELQQPSRAVVLAKKACDLNNPEGCYRVAEIYSMSDSSPEDVSAYYIKACETNFRDSCQKQKLHAKSQN